MDLRQSVEQQLSRVEPSNKFTRAVAVGDPNGFSDSEREEQEISESCNRLIKNSIICWNYLYLTKRLYQLEKEPSKYQDLMSWISNHSVIAWSHVNMLGEYDFSDKRLCDSFGIHDAKIPPLACGKNDHVQNIIKPQSATSFAV